MKVNEVMTENPLTAAPGDTVGEAEEILNANAIRQLPVVEGSELVGIVTDRDIRSFLGGHTVESLEQREKLLNTKIASIMTTQPVSLAPDDDLREAVEILIEEKVGAVPVVDEDEGLVGIVTYVDVLRCFLERLQE